MFDESRPEPPAPSENRLADALGGLIPVAAADALGADEGPRPEPTVEVVLRAEWDYVPPLAVEVADAYGFRLVAAGARTPDHRYAVFSSR